MTSPKHLGKQAVEDRASRLHQHLYFTTVTILECKHLLRDDNMKDVVIESLRFLAREKRAVVYGFVIMPNHIHSVQHIPEPLPADRNEGCTVVVHRTSVKEDAENEKTVSKGAISRGFERKGLSVLEAQCFFGGYLPRCSVLAEDGVPALAPLHRKVEVGSRTEVVPVASAYATEGESYWDFVSLW